MVDAPSRYALSTVAGAALERGAPAAMLAADAALLSQAAVSGRPLVRWYLVDAPALVLGFAQRARRAALVDEAACAARGVAVLERQAGGGLVLLNSDLLAFTVALPRGHPWWNDDLTASYRWLGGALRLSLGDLGVPGARGVEVPEARTDVAGLRATGGPVASLLLEGCFAVLSPHEVVAGSPPRKVVGLAQVRRAAGALFQGGVLLRSQAGLADLVRLPNPAAREAFRYALEARTVGLDALVPSSLPPVTFLAERLSLTLAAALALEPFDHAPEGRR